MLVLRPWLVLAEVMDKEAPLSTLWIAAVVIGIGGAIVVQRWRWAMVLVMLFAILFAVAVLTEIYDPYIEPAIREEAGLSYVVQAHLTVVVTLVVPWFGWRRSKKS